MAKGIRRHLLIPDLHYPFHCPKFVELMTKIIWSHRFSSVTQLGDAVDFYQISRFSKEVSRKSTASQDLKQYRAQMYKWQTALLSRNPKAVWNQLEGNHEQRLQRFMNDNPKVEGFIRTVPEILGIDAPEYRRTPMETNWHPLNVWNSLVIGDCVIHHGEAFGKHVAVMNCAIYGGMTEYRGFIQGHTHRLQKAHEGPNWSATIGHGTVATKTMHLNKPTNWVQAFGILNEDIKTGKTHLSVHTVNDGSTIIDGGKCEV